ncbi:MAG: histidine kinase [Bacteroidales bacterium]|nr:histidine kinase [Bacteroidales bacterium]
MKKAQFVLLLLFSPCILFSQTDYTSSSTASSSRNQIDSLRNLLSGSEAIERVDILNELASCFAGENFDSSIFYSSQAARLATINGYQKGIGIARYETGNAYYYNMDFKNALVSYLSAQSILENGSFNKELGDVSLMIGNINLFIWRGDEAINAYKKAIRYYTEAGSDSSLFAVYDAISMTVFFLSYGSIDSALVYGYKMLDHSRKYDDRYAEAYSLMQIGMFYSRSLKSVTEKQKTLLYCDSAMAVASDIKQDELITIIHVIRGNYYDELSTFFEATGDLSAARKHYENAYKASLNTGCSYLQAIILIDLAKLDLIDKNYKDANIHLELCDARLKDFFDFEWKNTPAKGKVANALGKLMDYFMAQRSRYSMCKKQFSRTVALGDYEKAIDYLLLSYEARDSMFASQKGKQVELLITEDETEKQQQKIQTLAKDNELNRLQLSRTRFILIGIGAGILMISVILLLILQRRKLRADQRSVSMEQRLLRAQMNPHFIFNSLASIQNFVINEDSDQASIYLSRFSQLVRNILDNSVEEYVPLEKEINTIENYLELQKVRYASKFDYQITVDEKIDQENMLIPPMLAQPFIENAIEHGIRHKATPGHIGIRFHLQDGLIRFEVEDDGVGREKAREIESKQKSRHRSMATSITRDRLNTLNKKLKKKIRMEITDLKDDTGKVCGTRVEFGIPVVGG